jgi:hypothetical protein
VLTEINKYRKQGLTATEIIKKLSESRGRNVTLGEYEKFLTANRSKLVKVSNKKITKERLKWLDEAAQKYGYESYNSIPNTERALKGNIARDATRRQKNVPVGKGSPGQPRSPERIQQIRDTHWSKKPKAEIIKIMNSPAYLARDLKKVKDQIAILKAVQSGKYKTADEIRKVVGLTKEVFDDKVDKLYTNLYTQIGNMNKKKVRSYVRKEFLPHDLNKLEKIRDQLGAIKGFRAANQRNIWHQIYNAYGQKGITPNRKAYEQSMKKAGEYFEIKNVIQKKFPGIKLELDHPLDYKTIEGLGKKGEKFLHVTPIDRSINRGFKEVLGKRYAEAIKAGDKNLILQIENLAKDVGLTVGKVRRSKVMDYGTASLRGSDLGAEIISNLRQQNVIADKISKMQASGELKTRLGEVGIKRTKDYVINKIPSGDINKIAKELYKNAPKGAPIRKYLEKNIAHCADGCFVKVANKNPERIAANLASDPKIVNLFKTGQLTTADKIPQPPLKPGVENVKAINEFVKRNPQPEIKYDDTLGSFVKSGTDDVVSQAGLKAWAKDNPMPVQAGTSVKPGLLRKTGRALAHLGLPLPTAAMDTYFIGRQIEEGRDATEIAKDPFNWLGLATMEPLTKAAGMADKSGKLASVARLGMSPGMIRGATRFLGLPGLALSTGLTAYDQYKKYQNKEGFIYDLFNE